MKKDFCEELKGVYKNDLFDNEMIKYHINGLMDVLELNYKNGDIKENGFYPIADEKGNKYICDAVTKTIDNHQVRVMRSKGKKDDWLRIIGDKSDIQFCLDEHYNKRKLEKENINFELKLKLKSEEKEYYVDVKNENGCTYYKFKRLFVGEYYSDIISFIVKRNDFEGVLSIIMKFLENPDYVINMYLLRKKNDVFFMENANTYLEDDIIMDKNGKKYEKVIK